MHEETTQQVQQNYSFITVHHYINNSSRHCLRRRRIYLSNLARPILFYFSIHKAPVIRRKNSTTTSLLAMIFSMYTAWPRQTGTGFVWYRSVISKMSFVTQMFRFLASIYSSDSQQLSNRYIRQWLWFRRIQLSSCDTASHRGQAAGKKLARASAAARPQIGSTVPYERAVANWCVDSTHKLARARSYGAESEM